MMNAGPDFICIGLPKAGTGWLADQLGAHPDFWMPPVKELLYLIQPVSKMRFVTRRGKPRPNPQRHERRVTRAALDARDQAFLKNAAVCRGQPMDLTRYGELFAPKGELLSGDVSPPYWGMQPQTIESVAARFPAAKILLLVRDPVERAWSRISMAWRGGLFDAEIADDAAKFNAYLANNRKIVSVRATEIVERWRSHAPNLSLGTFLFDDIAERPDAALRDILVFLGADPDKRGLAADFNRKADTEKLPMSDIARAALVEHYADELRASASAFAGAAEGWAARYGV